MNNHFHLVVETPSPNLVAGMKWFLGTYTQRFNRRHHFWGHLFSGRYKTLLVEGRGNGYLKTTCDCVHLNPVWAGLLRPEQPLEAYAWSSYPLYLWEGTRPGWLRIDRLLGEWGLRWEEPGVGRCFAAVMEARRQGELEEEFQSVRRGWCLGSSGFRAELLAYVAEQRARWHYGAELRESAEAKAECLITVALQAEGLGAEQLAVLPKGHPFKVRLARQLRAETTVTVEWIARRLAIGSRGHLAHLLHRQDQSQTKGLLIQVLLGI